MFKKIAYLGLCIGIKQALSGQRHCLNKSLSQPKMKNLVSCSLEVYSTKKLRKLCLRGYDKISKTFKVILVLCDKYND